MYVGAGYPDSGKKLSKLHEKRMKPVKWGDQYYKSRRDAAKGMGISAPTVSASILSGGEIKGFKVERITKKEYFAAIKNLDT